MKKEEVYSNSLASRYAGKQMSFIWSSKKRIITWRKLWLALAQLQQDLGLSITDEQLKLMQDTLEEIDFNKAEQYEKKFRHDVMSHIHTWGDLIPKAKPIIHLGATSCFVTDNADLILLKQSLELLSKKLLSLIAILSKQAEKYKALPTLAFTHYQPAQLTTVGKRICLWIQDLLIDWHKLQAEIDNLTFRGVKGTTGTQASFLNLFNGDFQKVKELDKKLSQKMGFDKVFTISGQTYTRKLDFYFLSILAGISASLHKMAVDIRLLSNLGQLEEPFEEKQIGSSAMAYKRNPMRSERICSLARFVINLLPNTLQTHCQQWFERTLDDSANRRLILPQSFLAVDAILNIAANVSQGFIVFEKVIEKQLKEQLPFIATENIIMQTTKKGGDRQELHEAIRKHAHLVTKNVKQLGLKNDLIDRIKQDPLFSSITEELDDLLKAENYVGCSQQQVEQFLQEQLFPLIKTISQEQIEFDKIEV